MSSSRRWTPTPSSRGIPRSPWSTSWPTRTRRARSAPKRWEDVDVLLDAGIDVVSTCNIQHLDSVADAVATITGAPVNERIPDEVLAAADEVELVDMSPYALRQRMRHGNVYPPERARIALDRFFTESNLTALRELALRFVAGRVDAQLEGIGTARPIQSGQRAGPRPRRRVAGDAAGAAPGRGDRGRPARAAAGARRRDAGRCRRRRPSRRAGIREHLDDATDLGAEIVTVEASDVAEGVVRSRAARRVTRLVMPHRTSTRARAGAQVAARRADPRAAARRSRSRSSPTRARRPMPIRVGRGD